VKRIGPDRRLLLAGLAAFLAAPRAYAGTLPPRVATIDWAVLETLLALGVTPVAATELVQFRSIAVEPAVPQEVADLGLRGTVNYELLQLLSPDLIFSSNFYAASEPRLARIAPVERFSVYAPGERPFEAALAMTRRIGERLGVDEKAQRYVTGTEDELARIADVVAGAGGRPVMPINLGDARHFRAFGADSMFGAVLGRLGIANAWSDGTRYSAMAPVGLEALARVPDAWIVLIAPTPPDADRVLARSAFWNALPNVRAGRVLRLGPINPYGALPAARRFGRLLASALSDAEARGHG
jgi:ABC-type Fe3+-hydroxamate transport system, periplasmic component